MGAQRVLARFLHPCGEHQERWTPQRELPELLPALGSDLRSLWGSSSRVEKGLLPAGLAAATGALTLSRARGHQGPSVVLAGGTRALPVEGTRDSRAQSPQTEAFVSRCVCTLTVSKAGSEELLGFAAGPGSLSRFIQSGTVQHTQGVSTCEYREVSCAPSQALLPKQG